MKQLFEYKTLEEIKSENTYNDNLYGLVYQGAITENKDGQVNIHPISYPLRDLKIAANIYVPADYKKENENQYPAVVVAHPNGGVKEQVAGLYAQHLAEIGYIALAMDASYQGRSSGMPRNTDTPANRIEDIHRAADIIATIPGVDADRIGILGICGGGGYTIKAVQTDKRFKAVATLSLFNSGLVRRNGFMDSQTSTIQQRLLEASNARIKEKETGVADYTPNMCDMPESEAKKLPYDLYRDGYFYYGQTHKHPNSTFSYTVSSLLDLMSFDAAMGVDLIDKPLLMMAGSKADTFYMTEHVFSLATGTQNKEIHLIHGATHIETYWKPEYVQDAMNKLTVFFEDNL